MSRTITAGQDAATASGNVTGCLLAYLDFSSGIVRVSSLTYNIDYGGYTWMGAGAVSSIDAVQESADQQVHDIKMKLSGVPSDKVATALGEYYQGRPVRLYWAQLSAKHQIEDAPVLFFEGRIDTMEIGLGAQAMITLTGQSRLADWNRARVRRYNDGDQQAAHPGDLFAQYVEQMVSVELIWGQAGSSPSPVVAPASYVDTDPR